LVIFTRSFFQTGRDFMNRFVKYAIAAGISLVAPAMAQANVVINLSGGYLYKGPGTSTGERITPNSTLVLLIDANGNGFGDLTQALNSWTADAGDVVAARFGSSGTAGRFSRFDINIDLVGTVGANDKLMLVWYDKPFNAGDIGPGAGTKFGTYRTDAVINNSDSGWVLPGDGGTVGISMFTVARATELTLNDGVAETLGVANQVTAVPEPASLGLMALCGGALLLRRRRA
jgi:hypothetical protein